MSYAERRSAVPGAVIWTKDASPAPTRVLPDGCLDVIWDGSRLFVAGPDSAARWHTGPTSGGYAAVRFSHGLGPAVLGVHAAELRDQTPDLAEIWLARWARELAEQVAAAPVTSLERWLLHRMREIEIDPFGAATFALARDGAPVSVMADRTGLSVRQLHRRCLTIFGYGPRHLVRVLRMSRALDRARAGMPLAEVAAVTGYADQAHLTRDVRELAGATPKRLVRESAG